MSDQTGGSVICARCAAELKRGNLKSPLSHGICISCMAVATGAPIEDLSQVPEDSLDALPFGAIRISGNGIITAYSRAESALSGLAPASVLGKNFFRDVAPCTAVQRFYGIFQDVRAKGKNASSKLRFVFKYARGAKLVDVVIVYHATSDSATLLVEVVLSEPKLSQEKPL